jgi:hypothetical protein
MKDAATWKPTFEDEVNGHQARETCDDQRQRTSVSPSSDAPIEHENGDEVGGNLNGSQNGGVEVNVSKQIIRV